MDYLSIGEGTLAVLGGLVLIKGAVRGISYAVKRKIHKKDYTGRIFLRGVIKNYQPFHLPIGKEIITPSGVEELVESALKDKVKGLLLVIDSPGGEIFPTQEIAEYIKKIEIPTVAVIEGCAGSGAYWIASACKKIVANKFSLVGGLGVTLPHIEFSKLLETHGVSNDSLKIGEYKDMGVPFRPFTDDEKKILERYLSYVHEEFIIEVAKNRGLAVEEVKKIANGLTYYGNEALSYKLVDEIGSEYEAILLLEKLGNFKNSETKDYEIKKPRGLLNKILGIYSPYNIGQNITQGIMERLESSVHEIR
jgi:protease-4